MEVQPNLDVQFNLNVDKAGDDVHEVSIKIEVTARSDNGVHFVVDLSYAGLFGLRNIPEEALGPFLLVEAPRLIFPFARQIVVRGGHQRRLPAAAARPDRLRAAYVAQLEAAQAQQADAPGSESAGRTDVRRLTAPRTPAGQVNEPSQGDGHDRRPDPCQPDRGLRSRDADVAHSRRGRLHRRFLRRIPAAQHLPAAVRRRRLFGRVRAALQPAAAIRRRGRSEAFLRRSARGLPADADPVHGHLRSR